jgi:hypothetical protein
VSLLLGCVVCDQPVANQYAPSALCERCQEPCATCGGDVGHCSHPLRDSLTKQVERELLFTQELQRKARAA